MALQVFWDKSQSQWIARDDSGFELAGIDRSALIDQVQREGLTLAKQKAEAQREQRDTQRKQREVRAVDTNNIIADEWRRRITLRQEEVRDWRRKGNRKFATDYWAGTKQWRRRTFDIMKVKGLDDAVGDCDDPHHTLGEILELLLTLPSDPRTESVRIAEENLLIEATEQGLNDAVTALVQRYGITPHIKPLPEDRNLLAMLMRTQDALTEDVTFRLRTSHKHPRRELIPQRGKGGCKGYAVRGLDRLVSKEMSKRSSLIAGLMCAAGLTIDARAVTNLLR